MRMHLFSLLERCGDTVLGVSPMSEVITARLVVLVITLGPERVIFSDTTFSNSKLGNHLGSMIPKPFAITISNGGAVRS